MNFISISGCPGLVHSDGQLSNPNDFSQTNLVQLMGLLSNPPNRWTLKVLGTISEGASRPAPAIEGPRPKRLGNGVVQRGVRQVLLEADGPICLADIHSTLEARLGQSVSLESIKWCLGMGIKAKPPWVERVKRGWYRAS